MVKTAITIKSLADGLMLADAAKQNAEKLADYNNAKGTIAGLVDTLEFFMGELNKQISTFKYVELL